MMNRESRRRIAKAGVSPAIQQELIDIGRKQAIRIYNATLAITLRDSLGFGAVRVSRFLADVCEKFDSVLNNYADIEDYERVIFEETGINLNENPSFRATAKPD